MKKFSDGIHVQNLVARHMSLWEAQRQSRQRQLQPLDLKRGPRGPYITFSRVYGSGGLEISKRVAERLGWQHFDRQIVEHIAGEAHSREALVKMFDEHVRSAMETWVHNLLTSETLDDSHYFGHLVRVVNAIATHGKAVIIGRGANFILPPEPGLRVRVIAPLQLRIQNFVRDRGISREEAEHEIAQRDAEQIEFIRRHFHRDSSDPFAYDLILNTAQMNIVDAVEVVARAAEAKLR